MSTNVLTRLTQIIRQAVNAADFEHQVQAIVDGISYELDVDVCSLYRSDDDQNLVLVCSHGLANQHPVHIPNGKGLVGQVVLTGEILNITHPDQHPAYFYVPESDEEAFHSFCGVPLILHAQVLGVLVVQNKRAELLDKEEEALLLTLASHLALMMHQLPDDQQRSNRLLTGVSGAVGQAIGHALNIERKSLSHLTPQYSNNVTEEKHAWEALQTEALAELQRERHLIEQGVGESIAALIDAYQHFLLDPAFVSHLESCLEEGSALPWAIKQTVGHFVEQFLSIDDPYLQARHEDIIHLGDKLYQILNSAGNKLTQSPDQEIGSRHGSYILCGDMLSVSDIISLPANELAGIVCGSGAALSHVAVFANALGIPAVMGVGGITINDGDLLIVDGDHGEIHISPPDAILAEFQALIVEREQFNQLAGDLCHSPAVTKDGQQITVMANSGLQADILPGIKNGADGIGLYRTELPFMTRANLPTESEQVEIYRRVIEAYDNKPVCFRLLDVGGDKPLNYLPSNAEENPALGLRGVRFLLDNELILKTQLRAILLAAQGQPNIQVLVPMITTTSELIILSELLDAEVARLLEEGFHVARPPLGIMVEVPAVISMLSHWHNRIDFVSIGSNDLCQYLLAVDRNNPLVAQQYDPLHPAVLRNIQQVATTASIYELPVCLCGEMASDPISVLFLMGMGIRRFSMSAARIPSIKWLIQQTDASHLDALVNTALTLDDATKVRKLGEKVLAALSDESKLLLRH